jgi:hypothetical protein
MWTIALFLALIKYFLLFIQTIILHNVPLFDLRIKRHAYTPSDVLEVHDFVNLIDSRGVYAAVCVKSFCPEGLINMLPILLMILMKITMDPLARYHI